MCAGEDELLMNCPVQISEHTKLTPVQCQKLLKELELQGRKILSIEIKSRNWDYVQCLSWDLFCDDHHQDPVQWHWPGFWTLHEKHELELLKQDPDDHPVYEVLSAPEWPCPERAARLSECFGKGGLGHDRSI